MCLGSLVTFSNLTSTLKIYMVENVLHERYTRVMVIKSYEIISSLKKKIARILNLVCTFICIFVCIGKEREKKDENPEYGTFVRLGNIHCGPLLRRAKTGYHSARLPGIRDLLY